MVMAQPSDEQLKGAIKRGERAGKGLREFLIGRPEKKLKARDLKKAKRKVKVTFNSPKTTKITY
jgi:hypothetical protein